MGIKHKMNSDPIHPVYFTISYNELYVQWFYNTRINQLTFLQEAIAEALSALGGSEAELFSNRDARQLIRQIDQQLDKTIGIRGKELPWFASKYLIFLFLWKSP
jgi:hypothetical protein